MEMLPNNFWHPCFLGMLGKIDHLVDTSPRQIEAVFSASFQLSLTGAWCFVSDNFQLLRSELNSLQSEPQRDRLRTEISINKAERAKPLRTDKGSCGLNSRDPN